MAACGSLLFAHKVHGEEPAACQQRQSGKANQNCGHPGEMCIRDRSTLPFRRCTGIMLVYAIYQFSFTSFQTAWAMLVISSTLCRLASP